MNPGTKVGWGVNFGNSWSAPRTTPDGKISFYNIGNEAYNLFPADARYGKVFAFQRSGWGITSPGDDAYAGHLSQTNFGYSSDPGWGQYIAVTQKGDNDYRLLVNNDSSGLSQYLVKGLGSEFVPDGNNTTRYGTRGGQTYTDKRNPFGFNIGSLSGYEDRYFMVDQGYSVGLFTWDKPDEPFREYFITDLFPYLTGSQGFIENMPGNGQIYSAAHDSLIVADTTTRWTNISDPSASTLWTGTVRIIIRAFR